MIGKDLRRSSLRLIGNGHENSIGVVSFASVGIIDQRFGGMF
jgi:hypothetical protein